MFPREVYLHSDPTRVYDCVSWDANTRKYTLISDTGLRLEVLSDEFTPVSMAGEELIQFTNDGKQITVQDLVDDNASFSVFHGPSSHDQPTTASGPRKGRKPRGGGTGATDEAKAQAKAQVAEMLGSCGNDRDEMAKIAGEVTGDHGPDLVLKYKHLDNGRFRMVLGNKMRSWLLKG